MARTEQKPVFGIYLKDFNAQVMHLGEVMGIPLVVRTRFGLTGDYMEHNPHAATAQKCFYLEIVMFEEHVLFRAFTSKFDDASKILFIDGVKKELYKLAIQLLAQQQIFLINNQQPNGQKKLDLEDPPGYPAKTRRQRSLPSPDQEPEDSDRKEDEVQSEVERGLAKAGGSRDSGTNKETDQPDNQEKGK